MREALSRRQNNKRREEWQMATAVILILIFGYCGFLIYRSLKNKKEGKHTGCGCSCSSCPGACGCASEEAVKER